MPLQSVAAEAVNTSALGARSGISLAPEVVVGSVGTVNLATPLIAVVGALLDGCSRCSEGKRCRAGVEERGELHDVVKVGEPLDCLGSGLWRGLHACEGLSSFKYPLKGIVRA